MLGAGYINNTLQLYSYHLDSQRELKSFNKFKTIQLQ